MSAQTLQQMLQVSLVEVGTVLRLQRDAWSMVKGLNIEVMRGKKRNERPNVAANVAGVSSRSRSGAPSPKGCVVNGQRTMASYK